MPAEPARYLAAEAELARLFRRAMVLALILVVGLGGWGAMASIGGAVIASGTVAVGGKRKAIQHLDGGVIARLHVADGDKVAAGAPVVTLDARELDNEIAAVSSEIAARGRQIKFVESELENLLTLEAKRLVAHSRVSALQKEAASLAAEVARLTSQLEKVKARRQRVEITAPVAGHIHNLTTHTVGGVIGPNATIAEIVPALEGLVVEARLSPQDVDQVHPGQHADVRMTSLNQRSTPLVSGTVERVSADLLRDEQRTRDYYVVRVVLADDTEKRLGATLVPGMPAEVFIATQPRSAISYLTKPLTDQIMRAFRED